MNTILEAILKADFLATEQQVQNLASVVVEGHSAGGTYCKVLVAHCLAEVAGKRKPDKAAQVAIVDAVHMKLYAFVLLGVGPQEMDAEERNRRATFARTAASDLRAFVRRGGQLRDLDPFTVTKHSLRSHGVRVPRGTRTRAQRSFERSVAAISRAAVRIAKTDARDARKRLETARAAIDKLLAQLGKQAKTAHRSRPASPARVTSARGLVRQPVAQPTTH